MKKVLIFSGDFTIGTNMSGIGLRLWEIAEVLSNYCKVTIIANTNINITHAKISVFEFCNINWEELIEESDCIFCSAMPDTRVLLKAYDLNKTIICDNGIPIEHLDYANIKGRTNSQELYDEILERYRLQILLSDHFIVRSTIERATLLASLAIEGRINYANYSLSKDLKHMISFIPIGFNYNSDKRKKVAESSKGTYYDFIWNGGIWNYFNTNIIVDAFKQLIPESPKTNLLFMYKPPENQLVDEYRKLTNNINFNKLKNNLIFPKSNVDHFNRDLILCNSKAFICIGERHIENFTCNRLRLRDVLLYEKPIIIDSFGSSAEFVKQNNIGICVSNTSELKEAILKISNDKEFYTDLVTNIKKIREEYIIDNNIFNTLTAINHNCKAPDKSLSSYKKLLTKKLYDNPNLLKEWISPI